MSIAQFPRQTMEESTDRSTEGRARWQPSRSGIINVWRYFDETFTFHEGRLLLRGQNGTGKSKALELLLPFLFDASLRPNRLSTFGGSDRTMHWNLMGEGASGKTRVGYVWVEFTRPATDDETEAGEDTGGGSRADESDGGESGADETGDGGGQRWFCIGARLQASVHTSGVHTDYFTTTQRVATPGGLPLVNEAGQPLTRPALADALRGHGEIHGSAAEYRAVVRRTLFPGLNEQRYDALITALLQLRTPKLSERLDPSLLSSLLSRALPPLGQGEITELAEGFERLDRQREHLTKLDSEVTAAAAIATQQRGYAQRVLRAAAAAVISATTEMDDLTRVARESEEQHAQAQLARVETAGQLEELEHRAQEMEGAVQGLVDSGAYQQGQELDQLRRRAEAAARHAQDRRAAARTKLGEADTDDGLAAEAEKLAGQRAEQVRTTREDTHRAARRAAMESVCAEVEATLGGDARVAALKDDQGRTARRLLRGAVTARRHQITEVAGAIDRYDRAVAERTAAERAMDASRERLAEATGRRDESARAYEAALEAQGQKWREWAGRCGEIRVQDTEELAALAPVEGDVTAVVEAAARAVDRDITQHEATVRATLSATHENRDTVTRELERLSAQTELPPPAPYTRTADRSAMEGAPLWRLVAFHDDIPAATQAGVEAALEGSGLLDAWVGAHGDIEVPGHDRLADAAWAVPPTEATLLEVLRPEPETTVPVDRVAWLLSGIAYGTGLPQDRVAAVAADGSWRLANTSGTWSKEESAYIGAPARERARQRQIAGLTERLAEIEAAVNTLDALLRALGERRTRLDADLRDRPRYRDLDARRDERDRAESHVAARSDAVRDAVRRLSEREDDVADATRTLSALSADHTLPTDREALNGLSTAVDALREVADLWLDAHFAWAAARETSGLTRAQAARSRSGAEEYAAEAEAAEAAARALAAELDAVESTVGEDYRQVAERISALRRELTGTRERISARNAELMELATRIGSLLERKAEDTRRRDSAVADRNAAALRFRHLCVVGLPKDADIELTLTSEDGTRTTLEAARETAALWPNLPHSTRNVGDAFNRLSEAVHKARQFLGSRADLDLEADDDIHVFTAAVDGVRIGAAQLLASLTADRDRGRQDITAAERGLFDKTLTGDTRRHLADRIRQANELVDRMNHHLERVRTASRVAVRLVWQIHPDLPAGTKAARELLLKDPERITEEDREALHTFFRGRIEEAKAKDTAATWEEQLSEVLDYTSWHQFVVKLDRANDSGWQLLTKRLHGALSGGEKAIALHLPLFAAVAAHYETVPRAPRLILLDEVFVGVDSTNRGQVFALLDALDLDFMLTSDHEWCTYRELSGIAIHQLITGADGDDAVTSARFTWNGSDLLADETEADNEADNQADPESEADAAVTGRTAPV
ncbi:TIGR02680 family protein [Streptomyces sp. NPDC088725]|uniref:TIGR02680 family protein n=1 Tax=Streptomyces sp. NPDC088725 TaxID=3365873 RepID=UPI00380AB399